MKTPDIGELRQYESYLDRQLFVNMLQEFLKDFTWEKLEEDEQEVHPKDFLGFQLEELHGEFDDEGGTNWRIRSVMLKYPDDFSFVLAAHDHEDLYDWFYDFSSLAESERYSDNYYPVNEEEPFKLRILEN